MSSKFYYVSLSIGDFEKSLVDSRLAGISGDFSDLFTLRAVGENDSDTARVVAWAGSTKLPEHKARILKNAVSEFSSSSILDIPYLHPYRKYQGVPYLLAHLPNPLRVVGTKIPVFLILEANGTRTEQIVPRSGVEIDQWSGIPLSLRASQPNGGIILSARRALSALWSGSSPPPVSSVEIASPGDYAIKAVFWYRTESGLDLHFQPMINGEFTGGSKRGFNGRLRKAYRIFGVSSGERISLGASPLIPSDKVKILRGKISVERI